MKNYKIAIIGYGVVGKIEYKVLEKFYPDIIDTNSTCVIRDADGNLAVNNDYASAMSYLINNKIEPYDLAVVCVPTPLADDKKSLDCSLVEEAVDEIEAKVYLIKSTTNIGYCDYLSQKTGKRIVHSPEHSGATQHCNNFEYNYTILGGDKDDCNYVQQIYQEIYDARHIFKYVDRKTSEASKLAINFLLASKVSTYSIIWDLCKKNGIYYEEVRQNIGLDPRMNIAYTTIYDEHPYWDSHCFNKDIPSIANSLDNDLAKAILKYNNDMKEQYNK